MEIRSKIPEGTATEKSMALSIDNFFATFKNHMLSRFTSSVIVEYQKPVFVIFPLIQKNAADVIPLFERFAIVAPE
jgi:hypothetical protein